MFDNGMPCHFGIYLDDNMILHHPRHKLSTIELLTPKKKEKITYLLRWN